MTEQRALAAIFYFEQVKQFYLDFLQVHQQKCAGKISIKNV